MDLIDLIAEIVQRLQAVLHVAPAGESPVYVQPPGGTKEWLPYVQAVGALGTIAAVTVAIVVPTRIQNRALNHDRNVRVNDDARRALADVIRTSNTAYEELALLSMRYLEARDRERAGKPSNVPDGDYVGGRFVRALSALRSSVAEAQLFFPPGSELEQQMDRLYDSIRAGSVVVFGMVGENALDDWEATMEGPNTEITLRTASFIGRSQQFARGEFDRDTPEMEERAGWNSYMAEQRRSPDSPS